MDTLCEEVPVVVELADTEAKTAAFLPGWPFLNWLGASPVVPVPQLALASPKVAD
jgi:hypothetical protein